MERAMQALDVSQLATEIAEKLGDSWSTAPGYHPARRRHADLRATARHEPGSF